jgi:hypothetical protein
LDPAFGYDFWRTLSFPDVYRLEFEGTALVRAERVWEQAADTRRMSHTPSHVG